MYVLGDNIGKSALISFGSNIVKENFQSPKPLSYKSVGNLRLNNGQTNKHTDKHTKRHTYKYTKKTNQIEHIIIQIDQYPN